MSCQLPPPGWWCSRDAGHDGPCAARQGQRPPIVCPQCGGKGYYFVKEFAGNDIYDEPRYRQAMRQCHVCTETVRRKRPGYI